MKKTLLIILSTLLILPFHAISADEKRLKTYCRNVEKYDDYIKVHGQEYIYGFEKEFELGSYIGKPFTIFREEGNIQVYPYFSSGRVVGTFELYDIDGEIGGCYSENYVEFLNKLISERHSNDSVVLFFGDSNGIHCMERGHQALVAGKETDTETYACDIELSELEVNENEAKLCDIVTGPSKGLSGGYCNWTTYDYHTNLGLYCAPISLFNIYKNMGYSDFSTYLALCSDICANTSLISAMTMYLSDMTSYLSAKNVHYSSGSTYMSLSDVQSTTQFNNKYALAWNHGSTNGHVTAVIGYYASTATSYYIFFDPHGSGTCRVNVSASTRTFTSCGTSYTWSDGYVKNIYK